MFLLPYSFSFSTDLTNNLCVDSIPPRDPKLCDFSGKSAIHYVSQVKSFKKQQLLDILMNSMPKPGKYFYFTFKCSQL